MLINGLEAQHVSVLDRGLQYGDGLFETIWVEQAKPMFIDEHLARLQKGCDVLGFTGLDKQALLDELSLEIAGCCFGVLKIILTREQGQRGFFGSKVANINRIVSFEEKPSSLLASSKSISLGVCKMRLSQQAVLAGIKHLSQIERVIARSEWTGADISESLMLDSDDNVIEGTMSNLFIVKDEVLITPSLSVCGISGIMRNFLLKKAKNDGIAVEISSLSLQDVVSASEVFLTNSLMPVWSVETIKHQSKTVFFKSSALSEWALGCVEKELQPFRQ